VFKSVLSASFAKAGFIADDVADDIDEDELWRTPFAAIAVALPSTRVNPKSFIDVRIISLR
jgi:hypothetical protein